MELRTPAELRAMQVKLPECSALTDSMFKTLEREPILVVSMPEEGDRPLLCRPWNVQLMSMGRSPSMTMQLICADMPCVYSSSPKLNGAIFGATFFFCPKKRNFCQKLCSRDTKADVTGAFFWMAGKFEDLNISLPPGGLLP